MTLMRSADFQRAFQEDPAGTAARELHLNVPAQAVSDSNKLLAGLLHDKAFNAWAESFQIEVERQHPDLTTAKSVAETATRARAAAKNIQQEFAKGIAAHLPKDLVSKLNPQEPSRGQIAAEDDIAILLLVFVAVVVVVVAPRSRDELVSRNTVRLLVNQLELLKTGPQSGPQ
jgi:hypothetical protein